LYYIIYLNCVLLNLKYIFYFIFQIVELKYKNCITNYIFENIEIDEDASRNYGDKEITREISVFFSIVAHLNSTLYGKLYLP